MPIYILTSIDTMIAAFAFGLSSSRPLRARYLCGAFMMADAAATLLGAFLRGSWLGSELRYFGPFVTGFYLLVLGVWLVRRTAGKDGGRINLPVLAVLLSFDNFVSAAATGQVTSADVFVALTLAALSSGVAAFAGFQSSRLLASKGFGYSYLLGASLLVLIPVL